MKVDLGNVITGMGQKPLEDKEGILTLKRALLLALIQANPSAKGTTPEEAIKTRKLFDKIDRAEGEVDFKSEEIVKLKSLVAERLSELVSGAVILALEPEVASQ